MRVGLLLLAACVFTAGCTGTFRVSKLERAAESLTLPDGALSLDVDASCASGCWGGGGAQATLNATYADGTAVDPLFEELRAAMEGAGWSVRSAENANDETPWIRGLFAQRDDIEASCSVQTGEDVFIVCHFH